MAPIHLDKFGQCRRERGVFRDDDLRPWLKADAARAEGRRHDGEACKLSPASLARQRRSLDNALARILKAGSPCPEARTLLAKIANAREQLFTFCDAPDIVAADNNTCERLLRPAVIQRKVTNGYRSAWAAAMEAIARTATDTAALAGKPRFQTILTAFS